MVQLRRRRVLYTIHSWTGAVFGILLFVVCLSGAWALLDSPLQFWEARTERIALPEHVDLDAALLTAHRHGVDTRNVTLSWPHGTQRYVLIRPLRRGASHTPPLWLDPAGLRVVVREPARMSAIVTTLHKSLYGGFAGRIVVSLLGVAMTLLLLGGIVLHPRRWAACARLSIRGGWRTLAADAHKFIGLWLFPLLLLISVTGAFSGLGALGTMTLSRAVFPGGMPQAMSELMAAPTIRPAGHPAVMPSLNERVSRHQLAHPAFRLETVTLQSWGDANATLTLAGTEPGQLSTALFEKYQYRAGDGQLLRHASMAGRGMWLRAFIAIQPLHFAQYGGALVTLLHFVGGLAAALLTASGILMWLARRQSQDQQVATVHAAALGACGGLLCAIALLMFVTSALPASFPAKPEIQQMVFWVVWAAFAVLSPLPAYRRHGVTIIAAVSGLGFLLAGAIDLVYSAGLAWSAQAPALVIDVFLLLAGGGLCSLAGKLRARAYPFTTLFPQGSADDTISS